MKRAVNKSIILLLISFAISLTVFLLLNFRIGPSAHMFVYLLTFLLMPYWLENNNINWKAKSFLSIIVGAIGIATIILIYGTGRLLNYYVITYAVILIGSIAFFSIKKKMRDKVEN